MQPDKKYKNNIQANRCTCTSTHTH